MRELQPRNDDLDTTPSYILLDHVNLSRLRNGTYAAICLEMKRGEGYFLKLNNEGEIDIFHQAYTEAGTKKIGTKARIIGSASYSHDFKNFVPTHLIFKDNRNNSLIIKIYPSRIVGYDSRSEAYFILNELQNIIVNQAA